MTARGNEAAGPGRLAAGVVLASRATGIHHTEQDVPGCEGDDIDHVGVEHLL